MLLFFSQKRIVGWKFRKFNLAFCIIGGLHFWAVVVVFFFQLKTKTTKRCNTRRKEKRRKEKRRKEKRRDDGSTNMSSLQRCPYVCVCVGGGG